MTELEKRAQKIINEKTRTTNEIARQLEAAKAEKLLRLNNDFKEGFNDVLDLLLEAGIAWKAGFQDAGEGYIEFTKDDKALKMDFSHAKSYRYCFVDRSRFSQVTSVFYKPIPLYFKL